MLMSLHSVYTYLFLILVSSGFLLFPMYFHLLSQRQSNRYNSAFLFFSSPIFFCYNMSTILVELYKKDTLLFLLPIYFSLRSLVVHYLVLTTCFFAEVLLPSFGQMKFILCCAASSEYFNMMFRICICVDEVGTEGSCFVLFYFICFYFSPTHCSVPLVLKSLPICHSESSISFQGNPNVYFVCVCSTITQIPL